ncbi:hypothetical protein BBO99_00002401 [Phytophthora kernoviae]|uniref:mannosyl-oligosaccharide 1,2-alpha-mannosidase n=2 Tax=Phytophthora kernoviae TaxID=325452 RepID=A0A3R7FWB9_9STRA|nr:hypothetical protein G195_002737 [Phytophthora kernoviae 00238/432]KAG2532314.1 hypothetical protein JM18_000670 [Phytophthora kernoviae]RLN02112.1 hypothetical protein BBI17_002226 [Phytophthora kernoviae]RLN83117.1 hypothetical protein BBO99_00002401 [Phytophthora kernoviae]
MQFVTEPEDIKQTGSELFVYPSNDFNLLQPETVESLMILYRVTGNNIYREYGHTIMAAFEKHCKNPGGGYRSMDSVCPRSKFYLLSTRLALDSSLTPTESSRDSEEEAEGAPNATKRRKQRQLAWNSYNFQIEEGDSSLGEEEDVTEEEWKLRANPLITIIVPPGPCGLVLQVDRDESGAPIVDGFVRKYDGRKGTIENSGLVKKGSVLCAINDIDVMRMPLKEVIRTLNLSSHLERAFTFRNGFQHRNSM